MKSTFNTWGTGEEKRTKRFSSQLGTWDQTSDIQGSLLVSNSNVGCKYQKKWRILGEVIKYQQWLFGITFPPIFLPSSNYFSTVKCAKNKVYSFKKNPVSSWK